MKLAIIAILTVVCIVLGFTSFKYHLAILTLSKWLAENDKIPTEEDLDRITKEVISNTFKKGK